MSERITHTGPLWRWTSDKAPATWHFLTIDGAAGEALSAAALMQRLELGRRAGFGSLKVKARIGDSQFSTSAFPSKTTGWLLPVKAAVRKAEGLAEGDSVVVTLDI
jgi:hypothetical protein